jgi:hypothetical protein
MNIRKIINEELTKIFIENYPMGAEYLSDAPWNQKDDEYRKGEKAKQIKYQVVWHSPSAGISIVKDDSGRLYVFTTDYFDLEDDYKEYADVPMEYVGKDEDGFPDYNEGEWELDNYVVENFINSNLDKLSVGSGLDAYNSGDYQLILIDPELKNDLLGLTEFLKFEKESFVNTLNQVQG